MTDLPNIVNWVRGQIKPWYALCLDPDSHAYGFIMIDVYAMGWQRFKPLTVEDAKRALTMRCFQDYYPQLQRFIERQTP